MKANVEGVPTKPTWRGRGYRYELPDALVLAMHADSRRGIDDRAIGKKYGFTAENVNIILARVLPSGKVLPPGKQDFAGAKYEEAPSVSVFCDPCRVMRQK